MLSSTATLALLLHAPALYAFPHVNADFFSDLRPESLAPETADRHHDFHRRSHQASTARIFTNEYQQARGTHALPTGVRNTTIRATHRTFKQILQDGPGFPVHDLGKYYAALPSQEVADAPHDIKNEFFHSKRVVKPNGRTAYSFRASEEKGLRSICTIKVGCMAVSAAIEMEPGAKIDAEETGDHAEKAAADVKGKLTFRIGSFYQTSNDGNSCNGPEKGVAKTCDQSDKNCDSKEMPIVQIPIYTGINFIIAFNSEASVLLGGELVMQVPFEMAYSGSYDDTNLANVDYSKMDFGNFTIAKSEVQVDLEMLAGISFTLQVGIKSFEFGIQAWLGFDADFQLKLKYDYEDETAGGRSTLTLSGSAALQIKCKVKLYYKLGLDLKGMSQFVGTMAIDALQASPLYQLMEELYEFFGGEVGGEQMCSNPDFFAWLPDFSIEGIEGAKYLLDEDIASWSIKGATELLDLPLSDAPPEFLAPGTKCAESGDKASYGALQCVTGSCGRTGQDGENKWECCASGLSKDHSYWYCDHQTALGQPCDVNAQCTSGACGRINEAADLACCEKIASTGTYRDFCEGITDMESCAKDAQCKSGACGKINQNDLGCCPSGELQSFYSTGTADVCTDMNLKNGESCYNDDMCASGHCIVTESYKGKTILDSYDIKLCDWNYEGGHACEEDVNCHNDHCGRVNGGDNAEKFECCKSGEFISLISDDYCAGVDLKDGDGCDYDEQCASGHCAENSKGHPVCVPATGRKIGDGCDDDEECESGECAWYDELCEEPDSRNAGLRRAKKAKMTPREQAHDRARQLKAKQAKRAAKAKAPKKVSQSGVPFYMRDDTAFGSKKKNEGRKQAEKMSGYGTKRAPEKHAHVHAHKHARKLA